MKKNLTSERALGKHYYSSQRSLDTGIECSDTENAFIFAGGRLVSWNFKILTMILKGSLYLENCSCSSEQSQADATENRSKMCNFTLVDFLATTLLL